MVAIGTRNDLDARAEVMLPGDLGRMLCDPGLASDLGLPDRHQIARRPLGVGETSAGGFALPKRSLLAPTRLLECPLCVVLLVLGGSPCLLAEATGQVCPQRLAFALAHARLGEPCRVLGPNGRQLRVSERRTLGLDVRARRKGRDLHAPVWPGPLLDPPERHLVEIGQQARVVEASEVPTHDVVCRSVRLVVAEHPREHLERPGRGAADMGVGVVVATDDEGAVLVAPAAHPDVELRGAHLLVDKDDRALGGLALRLVDDQCYANGLH